MTLRSSKIIWVCILCRKKQELLLKSGRWLESGTNAAATGSSEQLDPILRKIELDMALQKVLSSTSHSGDTSHCERTGIGQSASISSLLSKALHTTNTNHASLIAQDQDRSKIPNLNFPNRSRNMFLKTEFVAICLYCQILGGRLPATRLYDGQNSDKSAI